MVKKTTLGFDRDTLHTVTGIGQIPAGMLKGGVGVGVSGGITAVGSIAEADDYRDMAQENAGTLSMTAEQFASYSSTIADFLSHAGVKPGSSVGKAVAGVGLNTAGGALAGAGAAAMTGAEIGGFPGMAIVGLGGLLASYALGGVTENTIGAIFGEKPSAVASVQAMNAAKAKLAPSDSGQPAAGITSGDVLSIISYQLSSAEREIITKKAAHGGIDNVATRGAFDSDLIKLKANILADIIPSGLGPEGETLSKYLTKSKMTLSDFLAQQGMTSSEFIAQKVNEGAVPIELLLVDNSKLPGALEILKQKKEMASADGLQIMGYSGTGNPLADMGYREADDGSALPSPNVPNGRTNKRNPSLV